MKVKTGFNIRSRRKAGESGYALVETVVALAILTVTVTIIMGSLFTAGRAAVAGNEKTIAESLVQSQTEYLRDVSYVTGATSYPIDPNLSPPEGWTLGVSVVPIHPSDDGIQRLTVSAAHRERVMYTLESYKVKR